MKILLSHLLKITGFDLGIRTKLVRHKDSRTSIEGLRHNQADGLPWLDVYQAYQKDPVFHRAGQVISFYGLSGTRAAFYGVYKVLGCRSSSQGLAIPSGENWGQGCNYFYELERLSEFDDLRDRLIIDWGKGAINWNQWLKEKDDKEVLEVLAPGRSLPPFADYLKFTLSHRELQDLFKNEGAHRDWKNSLGCVAGIYLILAESLGEMYVGSAYGTSGIWGRWKEYARSKDGGNKKLADLIAKNGSYPEKFRFSVLQILPISTSRKEVILWEQLYKRKLGTRAIGLNSN